MLPADAEDKGAAKPRARCNASIPISLALDIRSVTIQYAVDSKGAAEDASSKTPGISPRETNVSGLGTYLLWEATTEFMFEWGTERMILV